MREDNNLKVLIFKNVLVPDETEERAWSLLICKSFKKISGLPVSFIEENGDCGFKVHVSETLDLQVGGILKLLNMINDW